MTTGETIVTMQNASGEYGRENLIEQIDGAIADARREQTEKCAEAVRALWERKIPAYAMPVGLRTFTDVILALNRPPIPVWRHAPDCPAPFQWNRETARWELPATPGHIVERAYDNWKYCPGCGEAKPK
jgi:hypothetical protein